MTAEFLELLNKVIAEKGNLFKGVKYYKTENDYKTAYNNGETDPNILYIVLDEKSTTVYEKGVPVDTFNADNKVDKTKEAFKLYGTDENGDPVLYSTDELGRLKEFNVSLPMDVDALSIAFGMWDMLIDTAYPKVGDVVRNESNKTVSLVTSVDVEARKINLLHLRNWATDEFGGLVRGVKAFGFWVDQYGRGQTVKAENADIDGAKDKYKVIVPENLYYSVLRALAYNTLQMTDIEKANAKKFLGIDELLSIIDNRNKETPHLDVNLGVPGEIRKAFFAQSLLLGYTHYGNGFIQDAQENRILLPQYEAGTTKQVRTMATVEGQEAMRKELNMGMGYYCISGDVLPIECNTLYIVFSDTADLALCLADGTEKVSGIQQMFIMTAPYNGVKNGTVFVAMGMYIYKSSFSITNLKIPVEGVQVELNDGSYIKSSSGTANIYVMKMKKGE